MERTYLEAVDEVRSRLDIVDVVSRYVVLKKSGSNYMGCCPFHNEKTPSFFVSRQKGIFKCFGCGEGGDAISFLMKIQNKSFREVIEDEGARMGIEIPTPKSDGNLGQKKKLAQEAMKAAAEFFTKIFNIQIRHNLRLKIGKFFLYKPEKQSQKPDEYKIIHARIEERPDKPFRRPVFRFF